MSLFGGLKKEEKKEDSEIATTIIAPKSTVKGNVYSLHNIIKHPRVTEKAAILSGNNVYTFEVDPKATKIDIVRAIKEIYKVKAVAVNISTLPAKRKIVRGRRGVTSAVKKAMVQLKKGDTIEFV